MDNVLLNTKWRNYFNWVVIIPFFCALAFIACAIFMMSNIIMYNFNGMSMSPDSIDPDKMIVIFLHGSIWAYFVLRTAALCALVYWVWYFFATDSILKILGENRTLWNVLNGLFFLLSGGILNCIVTFYLWLKIRNHWEEEKLTYDWRAVAYIDTKTPVKPKEQTIDIPVTPA